jgi:hypothetical protein
MDYDVTIEIMGECGDIEVLKEIIEAASEDAAESYWYHAAEDYDVVAAMSKAVEEGGMLTLVKSDTRSIFNNLRSACRDAGLSYVVSKGTTGDEGFDEAIFYRAGGEELETPLDVAAEVIRMREVREAAARGIEAVHEMIAEYDRKVLKDVEKSFRVPADVLAALAAEYPDENTPTR